ncbi:acetyltransferase-like isoleucine patch superfamily enzyme [Sulfurirhabdus autotrophica]|uniref:Acetyltransferase-like isoleucine patch superfamily enzyme n=2 Tax=Sulfurirhabdus autotrophica TaxID=1706046 RepID=A0A4V2W1H5_9PROT|nr:acetyltransferase-like isoleucine patch superfamily enzyme [Sulfurirhabdus autotrophica]
MTAWGWLAKLLEIPALCHNAARNLDYRSRMGWCGRGVRFSTGIHIEYPEYVWIGDGVYLNDQCWISIIPPKLADSAPILKIGAGTYIGRFATLACMQRVELGERVLISDRVFIGDAMHGFQRLDLQIADQPMVSPGPVFIGDGTWIGIGASILPNVRIGRHCVIGANAVVTRDVPDFHVAAGVPARILRKIDEHATSADCFP